MLVGNEGPHIRESTVPLSFRISRLDGLKHQVIKPSAPVKEALVTVSDL